MTSTSKSGVNWNTVRRAIIFCNDNTKRKQLEKEMRSAGISVMRGHDKSQLRGLRFTLAVIVNDVRQRQWFSQADLMMILGMMTSNGNQIVIM